MSAPGSSHMPPAAPTGLTVNTGDGAVSLAWTAPAGGGSPITAYTVNIQPNTAVTTTTSGTTAVVSGLANGTVYSFSVAAMNTAGTGAASTSLQATQSAANMSAYTSMTIPGDPNSVSGIFDPSIVRAADGTLWLAYSSAHYYNNAASQLVQDVSTSIAKSSDGGQSFSYVQAVGTATGPITVTDTTQSVCGQPTCGGRWIYEVPFLVEDLSDPNPARVFKLFAHKYFLYPPSVPSTEYILGAIVMWTASAPDGTWSAETPVLGWTDTPPELTGGISINTLHSDLAPCLLATEGSASISGSALDLVFVCRYSSANTPAAKIVLLRTSDHAKTFSYISTLLTPSDASVFKGAAFFNAPALMPNAGGAPALMVTPDNGSGTYLGCLVIPFADETAGSLIRDNNKLPVPILAIPTLSGHFGGACAWDRSLTSTGILIDDLNVNAAQPFSILATHKGL